VLATSCDPSLFDALQEADIDAFDLGPAGATTATAAPAFAAEKGHRSITFFGCESSYEGGTHAYPHYRRDMKSLMRVRCNGLEFLTTPDMMMQAEFLGGLIRAAPCFHERSGGLLEAFIASPEIDVIAATQHIHDALGAV
jgi:hypothetical protein